MNLCFTESIEGFPGYLITRDGRVISLTRRIYCRDGRSYVKPGRVLKPGRSKSGYLTVSLSKDFISTSHSIHVLVAETFIPNPENKRTINHKHEDGDKTRNTVENLEWATYKENIEHSYDILKRKSSMKGKFGKDNPKSRPVNQYTLDGIFIKKWVSAAEAKRKCDFDFKKISLCCLKKRKSHAGFKWEFAEC